MILQSDSKLDLAECGHRVFFFPLWALQRISHQLNRTGSADNSSNFVTNRRVSLESGSLTVRAQGLIIRESRPE